VSSLPDNGERLRTFSAKIEDELSRRHTLNGVTDVFSKLNIDHLEWSGVANQTKVDVKEDSEVKNTNFMSDPVLPVELDGHASYLCGMECSNKSPEKPKFLPHKTTKSDVHDPGKEKLRKQNKYWENTAATPPLIQHCAAKLLTLNESIELEQNQREKLKKISNEQASERLKAKQNRSKIYGDLVQAENFGHYRCTEQNSGASTDSDDDDDDEEEKGGVSFPVYD
jgi:DNA-directed RNA polymerase II subunit GRINL1A